MYDVKYNNSIEKYNTTQAIRRRRKIQQKLICQQFFFNVFKEIKINYW